MTKKMTIAEKYEAVLEMASGVLSDELVEFLKERKEKAVAKNATRKPTKEQVANEGYKDIILNSMESGSAYTVSEIMKFFEVELTNQKVSALLRQLRLDGKVTRNESKGKTYFAKVG